MDVQTCLKKLQYVGVLTFATVGADGSPQARSISALHFEPDAIYFFTARGKGFCRQLLHDGRVQAHALTRYKEMIRLSACARPVADDEQRLWRDRIFDEQPYLSNVYPGATRDIGLVFGIRSARVEYFNLGVHPIERAYLAWGCAEAERKGYRVGARCIGCGRCLSRCPQGCIVPGKPYRIAEEHCLHCGACFEACPVEAVQRLD